MTLSWHARNPLTGGDAWDVKDTTVVKSILPGGKNHQKFITGLDKVADFINSLVIAEGVKVPVIFRPWHEHTGSWFWWGKDLCSVDDYKQLWRMTYDRFIEKGVDNVLYAYSPGGGCSSEEYMERYPGDDFVDLLGFDYYQLGTDVEAYREVMNKTLTSSNFPFFNKKSKLSKYTFSILASSEAYIKTEFSDSQVIFAK